MLPPGGSKPKRFWFQFKVRIIPFPIAQVSMK